ncbi:astacin Peptidase family M12A family protein [Asticcacaulis biprosthecium C19]|uniref:Astacin Peptidase family M12A family protein n=1 Tax=Asticcacaulis biprosthecium C19 TaxID=715226 RepID=F4QTP0_9CAUL|nr:M12 family metallopeptidase [Asticcacaulis biprosthecium]EGF89190.1 astacin Peptidase family M12A family protein [Asticcacaulis biprosthecium C19]
MRAWFFLVLLLPLPAQAGAVMKSTKPWSNATVPYQLSADILKTAYTQSKDCTGWAKWKASPAHKACKAMNDWHRRTGVRFVARDGLGSVQIYLNPHATSATVGQLPIGNQVNIQPGANYGSILHEFGHTLGLAHEHQRADRATYLNLQPFLQTYLETCGMKLDTVCNDVRSAFPEREMRLTSDYDPCSLMHYLANQGPRHKEDPRWSRIFTLTTKGKAAEKACLPQFAKLEKRCRKIVQKCAISDRDAWTVRRFHGLE